MEKHFATYNQSLALKELGFDMPCFGWYEHNGNFYYCYQEGLVPPSPSKKLIKGCCLAPLKSQVFEWFRKEYGYWSYIKEATKGSCRFYIEKFDEKFFNSDIIDSYEEAESACIDKLIELLQHDK